MPEKKRKQQSFEYGAIILLCSTMLVKIIGAIFKLPLSNLIGDLGFGYFDSAYALFTPIYTLAMAGLPIAISRIVAEHMANARYRDVRKSLKVTRRIFIITGLTGFVVMLLLIYPFVKLTDATGKTIYSLFAIAPALFFCCIMSAYRGYYEGLRNMYPTAASDVIEALGKLILGYGFAYIIMKISGDVALAAAGAMLGIMIGGMASATFLTLRYKLKGDAITDEELENSPEPQSSRATAKAIIMIAIPVVLASLANSVSSLVDVSMVKWQLKNMMDIHADTIRELYAASISDYNLIQVAKNLPSLTNTEIPTFLYGVRGKAFTLYNLVPTITSVLGVSALPVIASCWAKGKEKDLLKRNIESTMKFTAVIAMPVGMGFVFVGPSIMELMYNTVASVEIGGVMLRIYGATAIFAGLAIPMISMLQAIGKEKISLRNVAIGAVLKVIVNFVAVGIPTINIKGAAIGTLVSYMFIFVANLLSLIKFTGIVPNLYKTLMKPFIAAFLCGASAFFVPIPIDGRLETVLKIAVAAVVYIVVLVALGTLEAEDVLSLPKGEKLLIICKKCRIIR